MRLSRFVALCCVRTVVALNVRSSFHGASLLTSQGLGSSASWSSSSDRTLTMRKQKASDRRTRRRQRGDVEWNQAQELRASFTTTIADSPMQAAGAWGHKRSLVAPQPHGAKQLDSAAEILIRQGRGGTSSTPSSGGRGRSRKRSTLYNSLAFYHNKFLNLLTQEYQAEEDEVLGRIKASIDNPLDLETAGYALFDLFPQRRGNLFGDEVYRLVKASDATTTYPRSIGEDPMDFRPKAQADAEEQDKHARYLPPNHKFSSNDVVMITQQPQGSGDFFSAATLPTSESALSLEARVLNSGPTYLDVAIRAGLFEAAFGPAPNDKFVAGGNKALRLRADRFVSNVPYQRMVGALSQLTSVPERIRKPSVGEDSDKSPVAAHDNIHMDETIREAILATHAFGDPDSPLLGDPESCDLQDLSNRLAKPPMGSSARLAAQAMKRMKSNPALFNEFNAPQRAAIEAALTRRLTLIQGPPGTGKTVVAAAIGYGFAHQCASISPHTKTLACAFSNVGADNLAEALLRLGLKVVRVGKPSAVSESLWDYTLEAAIHRDPVAQKALKSAARATAHLGTLRKSKADRDGESNQHVREAATAAVKAAIQACNIVATKILREADVVVSTSTGASDSRLLAACGIVMDDSAPTRVKAAVDDGASRESAPDGLPPLSFPFVIIDEACQSVEPASLIPIVSSDSCRSLVMLGDPCQLPPTVRSIQSSPLAMSLMERLSTLLPSPVVAARVDNILKDLSFLEASPIKQAKSLMRAGLQTTPRSYKKRYDGSLLLSIQYRMHPSIAAYPSAIFYDGQLATPTFLADQRFFPLLNDWMPCGNPNLRVRVIDVGGRCNERQGTPSRLSRTVFGASSTSNGDVGSRSPAMEEQTTYWNDAEAQCVLGLVKELIQRDSANPICLVSSIGVVSPYNGQVQLIKSLIAGDAELREALRSSEVSIEVKSVDGYQGRERDVIIVSSVRSNRHGRIGFLHDWRRLNVAITRAKSALLIVGDMETLSENDRHWGALNRWALASRCVVNDYDDCDDEPSV